MKSSQCSLIALFLLMACRQEGKEQNIPPGLMQPKQLEAFLSDIHQAEAKVMVSGIRQDSGSALFHHLEKKIRKKHGLDSAGISKNLDFYNQHPELLDSVYAGLLRITGK